jgi:glutamine amidotransferase
VSAAANLSSLGGDLALIDAGGANLGSVRYALARLGATPRLVRDADELGTPTRIVLPGVGAAAPAMHLLRERGLDAALRASEAPLLGICLGMQLLFDASEEPGADGGDTVCLGLLPGRIEKLRAAPGVRVPHMGWNRLQWSRLPPTNSAEAAPSPLLAGIAEGDYCYFVHSYALPLHAATLAASAHAGMPSATPGAAGMFSAIVGSGRRFGMQFHPERSSRTGLRLLANFLEMPA